MFIQVSIDHAFGLPHLDINDEEDSQISNNTVKKYPEMLYVFFKVLCSDIHN